MWKCHKNYVYIKPDIFIVHSINKHQNIINSIFNSPVQKIFVGHLASIVCPLSINFFTLLLCPHDKESGGHINLPLSVRSSVQIQIHGLSGYLLLQFWSYSFNILQDVYTHNGGVHVHRIVIFCKYSQNDRQLDLVIFFVLAA